MQGGLHNQAAAARNCHTQVAQLKVDRILSDLEQPARILVGFVHKQPVGQVEPSAERTLPVRSLPMGVDSHTQVVRLGELHSQAVDLTPDEKDSLAAEHYLEADQNSLAEVEEEAATLDWQLQAEFHRQAVQQTHHSLWMVHSSAAGHRQAENLADGCTQLEDQEDNHRRCNHYLDHNPEPVLQKPGRTLTHYTNLVGRQVGVDYGCNHRRLRKQRSQKLAVVAAVAGCSSHSLYLKQSNRQKTEGIRRTVLGTRDTEAVAQDMLLFACTRRLEAEKEVGREGPSWLEVVADHILVECIPHP